MVKYNNVRQLYPLTIIERFICALTYLTFMFVGLVWLILCHITKKRMPPVVEYHIYQSFLLSVILYVVSLICEISFGFMMGLPYIGGYVKKFLIFTAGTPIYLTFTLVHFVIFIIMLYLAIFAFFGKYSYLPYISDMVKSNLRIR
ncbi:hypothetical protein IKA15_02630 [bacterium]|nr:hypothetical protein [bacterium]